MKWILFSLLLLSFNVFASDTLEWSDLDLYEDYTLNQDIVFENVATFKAGDRFEMIDRTGGEIPVIYFQFHATKCENPDLKAEMILINPNPEDTSTDRTIAVELEEGCNLGMWVEVKDYYSPSLFTEFTE